VRETTERSGGRSRTGFDIERVWRLAKRIAVAENADLLVVELAALLHDIADAKFNGGDETEGAAKADRFLRSIEINRLSS